MQTIIHVINTLAPVFLIIALGAALRSRGFLSAQLAAQISRLVYWVGLPALLFAKVALAEQIGAGAGKVAALVLIGMGACIVLALILAALLRMPGPQVGTFVQAAYRGNLAYVSLPVVFYAFANVEGEAGGEQAQSLAALSLALVVPLYNIAAVVALLASQHRFGRKAAGRMVRQIVTNPLLLACVAGFAWQQVGPEMPMAARRTLGAVGQFALPLALLCVGATLAGTSFRGGTGLSVLAAAVKVGFAPLIGFAAAGVLSAGPRETSVALIMLACPTAVASYVMADQMGGDRTLAAGGVAVSTVASVVSLGVAVSLVG